MYLLLVVVAVHIDHVPEVLVRIAEVPAVLRSWEPRSAWARQSPGSESAAEAAASHDLSNLAPHRRQLLSDSPDYLELYVGNHKNVDRLQLPEIIRYHYY